ncbi:hypothetical protein BZL30_7004 [Mycobacterium kansasii]|uniref:Uncharacterized protein n=1 Tax=Mycobacterium kansasii TaxID=1768 RepID=A0A1V3WPL6_MYCKA|nr:hypothetical protein BZL30_7004 [Mycobacterium kansasii]OOK69724.1 hypothetical protein BZL29_6160 [Mycobacterium kansasii]
MSPGQNSDVVDRLQPAGSARELDSDFHLIDEPRSASSGVFRHAVAGLRAPKTDRTEQRRSADRGMISAPMGMTETWLYDEYCFSRVWWRCW